MTIPTGTQFIGISPDVSLVERKSARQNAKQAVYTIEDLNLSVSSKPIISIDLAYTITDSDYTVECTANSFTVTLPTAVGIAGKIYNVNNTGTGLITVDTTSSQTINGSLTQSVNQWENLQVQSNGSNWIIL